MDLSREQRQAVEHLLGRVESVQLQTLGGYAGTGKTVVVSYLHAALPRWGACAYTGKAADVLRRKGVRALTIHGTIYRPVDRGRGAPVEFELKSLPELGVQGFLIDEASMVGRDILRDVLSFGLPVIAVGDHGQLPPVGEDAGLMRSPDVRLETIHRNAGPIARFAEHLRTGGDARAWPAGGGVRVARRGQATDGDLLAADQIVCAYNRTRVGLNKSVRRLLGRAGDAPQVGDRVICLRNDRSAGVFNGQQGVVEELYPDDGLMGFRPAYQDWAQVVNYDPAAFNAGKPPRLDYRPRPGEMIPFDFAYAVTAHKAQGDEFGAVVVFEERCDLWEHARWAYTAASRARDSVLWVAG